MRNYIDANVILRYLLNDVPAQSGKACEIINCGAYLCEAVLAEVVYVLRGVYAMPRLELAKLMLNLLDEVISDEREVLEKALSLYGSKRKLDFVDCLLIAHNQISGDSVFTFDKDLVRELVAVGVK